MSKKLIIYILYYELRKLLFGKKYIAGIEVTDKCNLRCSHCYYKKYLKRKESIPLSEWERRFKEYYKMGIRFIGFVGGEPSLRYDVLKLSEKYFKFIVVYTNGQIKIPKDFNHRILLSLDGFKEENDKIRGKGTFDKIIKNYKGDKRVVVCSVLSKANYKGEKWLKEFINFVRKMGFSGLNFDFYTPDLNEDNSLVLDENQRREIGGIFFEEIKRKDSILMTTKNCIDRLINYKKINDCGLKNVYIFTAKGNKRKQCVLPNPDCSRCGLWPAYQVPIYKFKEWFSHKCLKYKFLFKIE